MKPIAVLILGAVILVQAACKQSTTDVVVGKGTVMAGGGKCAGWFIQGDSGTHYELTDLDAEFQQTDLRVRYVLKKRNDLASVCMRGPIAEVLSIERL